VLAICARVAGVQIHGPTLTLHRLHLGMTQVELAAATGIEASAVCRLEKGSRRGTPAQMKALSEFFGISILELCGEAVA
jgi:transcriptional regulator with XRE-family HTH domain